ncbi:MAG: hypothetical protein MUD10_05670, partial [Candidatus Pacebacteria bacterium]|nr:hypothetical protein [Candidatus Paceibacterota bacterium]
MIIVVAEKDIIREELVLLFKSIQSAISAEIVPGMNVKKFRNKIGEALLKERGLYFTVGSDDPLIISSSGKKKYPLEDTLKLVEEFQTTVAIGIAYGANGNGATCLANTAALLGKYSITAIVFADNLNA